MKYLLLLFILCLIAAGLVWQYQSKYHGPVEKITIGQIARYPDLAVIADKKGFFKEQGLDVAFKSYENTVSMIKDLFSGNLDLISVSAEFLIVRNSFAGENLKILAIVSKQDHLWNILARKDKNIKDLKDLKGKKIGLQRKSIAEFLLGQFLASNGLSINDVQMVDLDQTPRMEKLESGEIDAIVSTSPFAEQLEKTLGDKVIRWSAQNGRNVYNVTYTRGDFVSKHPQAAERYLQALIKAENFVKNENKEAKTIMKEYTTYSDQDMNSMWSQFHFDLGLEQGLLVSLEEEAQWAIANKLTTSTRTPAYRDFIYPEILRKLKPEAVTLY